MITIMQLDPWVGPDRISSWLSDVPTQLVDLSHADVPSLSALGDGLIVLGGRHNALDEVAAPWLGALKQLLIDARTAELPTLGICLGHQVAAVAFGGEVELGTAHEEGPFAVTKTAAGRTDPLFEALPDVFLTAQSHYDCVCTLPPGATALASSKLCAIQAFRSGSFVGVQFHPEASPDTMARWAMGERESSGAECVLEGERMRDLMVPRDEEIALYGRTIVRAFAQVIAMN
ncbi:type 1 glutamine amidotransferase [Corynebacterium felinum]|uniref:GMP synthase (Glutamine-hydrolyzing) n=1 Tax=Corynebacterium felinum TaxID=131318 RepID=A0ABU2BAE7_9CORY|nr:type 1 glutamine amidotransferase [Corynebacterium felinum]MDF5819692.1 type 1 glutamine amidotransferase [Corynebacterium felinum]MDR7355591.1 GMP synthase (glutamine-hydrolyzing) [Corynebacterium felinum]WJY94941.1 GMP synthase [glutamine-hydrolyzing] [Corynebacterium felinum]